MSTERALESPSLSTAPQVQHQYKSGFVVFKDVATLVKVAGSSADRAAPCRPTESICVPRDSAEDRLGGGEQQRLRRRLWRLARGRLRQRARAAQAEEESKAMFAQALVRKGAAVATGQRLATQLLRMEAVLPSFLCSGTQAAGHASRRRRQAAPSISRMNGSIREIDRFRNRRVGLDGWLCKAVWTVDGNSHRAQLHVHRGSHSRLSDRRPSPRRCRGSRMPIVDESVYATLSQATRLTHIHHLI